jgi:hypothetical protein
MGTTLRELFPDGRTIFYEGDDPQAFRRQVQAEFGFDPAGAPGVYANNLSGGLPGEDYADLQAMPAEIKSSTWDAEHGWQFHCPPEHLDAIYESDRWPMGS